MANKKPPNRKSPGPGPDRKRLSAERAAAARTRIAAEQRRRRLIVVAAAVGAVVLVVATFIVVKIAVGGNKPKSGVQATAADATVTRQVASVPLAVFNTVGVGAAKAAPSATKGAALTGDGKPRVLYVGAEWCPYCAAERWPLAVALSRFGSFSGLGQVNSSPSDVYPSTPTLAFHGATYTSTYLAFTPKELQSNQVSGSHYLTLDTITGGDKTLFEKLGSGKFPFVDLGGTSLITGAQYDPAVLKGKTHQQVAAALSQPTTTISKAVIGSANLITANLCTLTGNKPAAVCSSAGVTTAAAAESGK